MRQRAPPGASGPASRSRVRTRWWRTRREPARSAPRATRAWPRPGRATCSRAWPRRSSPAGVGSAEPPSGRASRSACMPSPEISPPQSWARRRSWRATSPASASPACSAAGRGEMGSERAFALKRPGATRALGRKLGAALRPGNFVALTGELGSGKTLLVKAMAEGAGAEPASSPTFAIVNLYRGPVPLQHLDLYRVSGPSELFALGFDDLLAEPAATVCEAAEGAAGAPPPDPPQNRAPG